MADGKKVEFYKLAIGAEFTAFGGRYRKEGMSIAVVLDEGEKRGWGTVFMGETEVVSDGPLLPPEEAARWKPMSDEEWRKYFVPRRWRGRKDKGKMLKAKKTAGRVRENLP